MPNQKEKGSEETPEKLRDKYKNFADKQIILWHTANQEVLCNQYVKEVGLADNLYTKKDMLKDMSRDLVTCVVLMNNYLKQEDYEICATLRDFLECKRQMFSKIFIDYFRMNQDDITEIINISIQIAQEDLQKQEDGEDN